MTLIAQEWFRTARLASAIEPSPAPGHFRFRAASGLAFQAATTPLGGVRTGDAETRRDVSQHEPLAGREVSCLQVDRSRIAAWSCPRLAANSKQAVLQLPYAAKRSP